MLENAGESIEIVGRLRKLENIFQPVGCIHSFLRNDIAHNNLD